MLSRRLMSCCSTKIDNGMKSFSKSSFKSSKIQDNKNESARMQEFHEKLKADRLPPDVDRSMRFIDLVLVETDPKSGEIIPNSEKEPTKWGDWQHGGRVTDF